VQKLRKKQKQNIIVILFLFCFFEGNKTHLAQEINLTDLQ